jgi:hypothetical protein
MRSTIVLGLLLALPRAAFACPVCFGQNDSPLAAGMNQGILAMLVVTVAVLVAFASFFIHLIRRARLVAAAGENASAGPDRAGGSGPAEDGHFVPGVQGGTV